MRVSPLVLILLMTACDQGLAPQPEETIQIVSIEGVDAISALLTFRATGNPTVSVVVLDTTGRRTTHEPGHLESSEDITSGTIEFSPVGPAARSITLVAVWITSRTEIPIKRP